MHAAPSGITYLNTRNGPIDPEHLLQVGWKRVIVNCYLEADVRRNGRNEAGREVTLLWFQEEGSQPSQLGG